MKELDLTLIVDRGAIEELQFLARSYDGVVKLITATKNRLSAKNPEVSGKDMKPIYKANTILNGRKSVKTDTQGLEQIQDRIKYQMGKHIMMYWPIWEYWLKYVPGIGPFIAANLILLYYYRFLPVCQECNTIVVQQDNTFFCPTCNKSIRGGVGQEKKLKFVIERKDFSCVSAWWSYLGEANDSETGCKVQRKKGQQGNWSVKGSVISYQIGEAFTKQPDDHHYKAFYIKRKARKERLRKDLPLWRRHKQAVREARKLFLSHFWHVAHELEGLPAVGTYAHTVLKHDIKKMIPPYYWNGIPELDQEAA